MNSTKIKSIKVIHEKNKSHLMIKVYIAFQAKKSNMHIHTITYIIKLDGLHVTRTCSLNTEKCSPCFIVSVINRSFFCYRLVIPLTQTSLQEKVTRTDHKHILHRANVKYSCLQQEG